MKYIVIRNKNSERVIQEFPFIFPDCINHDEFAKMVINQMKMNNIIKDSKVVSAGFCNFFGQNPNCHGKSKTLNISSREHKDNSLISAYNYHHGLTGDTKL